MPIESDVAQSFVIQTPLGELFGKATHTHLLELFFKDSKLAGLPDSSSWDIVNLLRQELSEYFDGKRTTFTTPIKAVGTPFQQRVWQELLAIPYGETRSYAYQAERLGDPKAIRAVARANGQNPISILIPCHRVIGSNGSLTGFRGGIAIKRALLDLESGQSNFLHD